MNYTLCPTTLIWKEPTISDANCGVNCSQKMFDVEDMEVRLREEYKPLYLARRALKAMKGDAPH